MGGISIVMWDITPRCNLRCRHCYAAALYESKPVRELTNPELYQVLDNILTVGAENLSFYGGEPLLRKELPALIAACRSRGVAIQVVTNGTMLCRPVAESLFAAGLSGLAVSLDAATPDTYRLVRGSERFAQVLANAKAAIGIGGGPISLGFVLSRLNVHELPDMIRLAVEMGAAHAIITPMSYSGRARQSWDSGMTLTPEDLVDAAAAAAGTVRELGCSEDRVVLDYVTEPLVAYLNQAFGTAFMPPVRTCTPLKGLLFVRADGVAFPCKGALGELNLKNSQIYQNAGVSLLRYSLSEAMSSEGFGRVFDMAAPDRLWAGLPSCRGCPYFLVTCRPCPISAADPDRTVAEFCPELPVGLICQEARRRLACL
jgi:MoaA/NifB/PqqE/SkfB family radical SAM enzyme